MLASGGSGFDRIVYVWDVSTGTLKFKLTGHRHIISSVAFGPDGKTLATGSADKTARLWNVETGTLEFELAAHTTSVLSVSFSPDGKTLATGCADPIVRL